MTRTGRLTRYLLAELWTPTLLSIALWVSLLLMNQFFLLAQMGLQQNVPASTLGQLLLLSLPKCLLLAIPMGTLLGSLIAVGRLSADQELLALQGAGLGPAYLMRPLALHGLLFTTLALTMYWVVQPASVLKIREINARMIRAADLVSEIRPRVFFTQIPGSVVFVQEVDPKRRGVLDGVLLYQNDVGGGNEQLIVARTATVTPDATRPSGVRVDFRDGTLHVFKTNAPDVYRPSRFQQYVPPAIVPPDYLMGTSGKVSRAPNDMNAAELAAELREAKNDPDPIIRPIRERSAQLEAHARVALPFACLFFALLSAPLGMTRVRAGKGAGFAMSIGIIVAYWLIYTTLQKQALEGRLPIFPALWAANGAVALMALVAYSRVGGRSSQFLRGWLERLGLLVSTLRPGRPVPRSATSDEPRTTTPSSSWVPQIDRYIGLTFLRHFALSLGFCWLVVLLFEIKSIADALPAKSSTPATQLIEYFGTFVPGSMGLAVPVAALIGAVVTCTVFARTGELTAMRATGMSARRVVASIVTLTIVLCLAAFLVQDRIAPGTNLRAQALKDEILQRTPRTYGATPGGRWIFGTRGRLYHYRLFDPELRRFQGLSIYTVDLDAPSITSHAAAAAVRWDGEGWRTDAGWIWSFPPGGGSGDFKRFGPNTALDIDPPEHFARRERTVVRENDLPEQMSLEDLAVQIRALENSGFDTTRLRVEWHVKLARSLTPLVMVLLGLPFAFRVGRRGSMYGVGVALLLVLAYWAAFAITNALGLEGALPPLVAAWAPNTLFAVLGTWMFSLVRT